MLTHDLSAVVAELHNAPMAVDVVVMGLSHMRSKAMPLL